jgi:hypothetical protein
MKHKGPFSGILWARVEALAADASRRQDLESYLGGLAPWVMAEPGAVPPLPEEPGACNVLCEFENAPPGLAGGVILPLCWVRASCAHPGLPVALNRLAARVKAACRGVFGGEAGLIGGFHLAPSRQLDLEWLDISSWPLKQVESAWVTLVGGLYTAVIQGKPNAQVLASGAWVKGRGLEAVQGLEAKVSAIGRLCGKSSCREIALYVPHANQQDAQRAVDGFGLCVTVKALEQKKASLAEALAEYLLAVDVPPGDFQGDLRYAQRLAKVFGERVKPDFYAKRLARGLAERLRSNLPKGVARPEAMALVFSGENSTLTCLLNHVVRPLKNDRYLVFHTLDKGKAVGAVRRRYGLKASKAPIREDGADIGRQLERWAAGLRRRNRRIRLAVEITGGTKPMSVHLAWAAERLGMDILYLNHGKQGQVHVPGTEELWVVKNGGAGQKGTPGGNLPVR